MEAMVQHTRNTATLFMAITDPPTQDMEIPFTETMALLTRPMETPRMATMDLLSADMEIQFTATPVKHVLLTELVPIVINK